LLSFHLLDSHIEDRKQKYSNTCPKVTLKTSPPPATAILTSDSPQGCQTSSDPQGPLLSSKSWKDFKGEALV
jgi:hypothetical protein